MRTVAILGLLIVSLLPSMGLAESAVIVYPTPAIYTPSATFAIRANGKAVPIIEFSKQYDYTSFSLDGGPCQLEVTRLDGAPIQHYSISPLKLAIAGKTAISALSFSIDKPTYLIVEIDKLRRLVIAIDSPETDKPPATGPGIYNITADPYKADPTGQVSSTAAIQKAIDDATNDGSRNGIVYVPNGVYLAANLQLKSNVSLYLDSGAVLRCSGKRSDFLNHFHKSSERRDGTWFISTADGATNVRIFGRGTVDGDGKQMIKKMNLLSHLLVPINCSHFTMDGPILRDSALWGTVIARSNHVTLRNTKHFDYLDMGEDDCIDVCESQDVTIEHTIAVSLDDSYSFKSWSVNTDISKSWTGNPQPLHHVLLDDCLAWSRCFSFKIGAGVNQPEDDIVVRNSVSYDAAHGIGVSHSYGSGDVRNILFDNIDIERNTCDCLGRSWARFVIDKRKDGEPGGNVYDVRLHNIRVRDAGTMPVPVQGLNDQKMIHGITFDKIYMPGQSAAADSLEAIGVKNQQFADGISLIIHN